MQIQLLLLTSKFFLLFISSFLFLEIPDVLSHKIFTYKIAELCNFVRKKLLKQLGIKDNTQFIFKSRYPHINPIRKAKEHQDLKRESKQKR